MTTPRAEFLEHLLEISHTMPADNVAGVVAEHAAQVGLRDLDLYLVDYEQVYLVPLPRPGGTAEPVPIDSTLAGRAFIATAVVTTPVEGGERIWVPLLDGAERLGVLCVTVAEADADAVALTSALASVAALLVVSKNSYTDVQEKSRRTRVPDLAAELQLQLLPPLTLTHPKIAIAGVLENAYETGGDAFDYAVNGPTAHFGIFDAMGHGMSASLMAAAVVAAYRGSRRQSFDLAATYAALDEVVVTHFGEGQFVTAQIGQLDIVTGEFAWVNAGHPGPLIVRQLRNANTLDRSPSLPLGMGAAEVEVAVDRLSPGDRLLFYSDGVVEARAPTGEPFGDLRLADELKKQCLDGVSPSETMRRLLHAVIGHHGAQLTDDATMVLVEWPGPSQP